MTGVLLWFNTAAMGPGQLRSDCEDLYFTLDPLGNTPLLHWFESSCMTQPGSPALRVWVNLTLEAGARTISNVMFAYAADSVQAVWSWADTDQTEDWNDPPKYLRGCGGTVPCGDFVGSGTGGHSHVRSAPFAMTGTAMGVVRQSEGSSAGTRFASGSHYHGLAFDIDEAKNEPPYFDTIFAMVEDAHDLQVHLGDPHVILFVSSVPPLGWEIHPALFPIGQDTVDLVTGSGGAMAAVKGGQPQQMSRESHGHATQPMQTAPVSITLRHQPAIPIRRYPHQSHIVSKQKASASSVHLNDLRCGGFRYTQEDSVCSGVAPCLAMNFCGCALGWVATCRYPECWGKSLGWDDPEDEVCGPNGTCTAPGVCSCGTSIQCFGAGLECHGLLWSDPAVCNGRGNCSSPDVCTCNASTSYAGDDCTIPVCYGEPADSPDVCSGHGRCVSPETCVCDGGFTFVDDCSFGYISCDGAFPDAALVCSGHGTCVSFNNCSCNANWTVSPTCNLTSCGGMVSSNPDVCSTQGDCVDLDTCICEGTWTGPVCAQQAGMLAGGLSVGEIVGIAIGGLAAVLLVVLLALFFVVIACVAKKKNKDIVVDDAPKDALEELEKREARVSVAKLEIDQSLFEINYPDIKVKRTIGSGGSSAIVFQAEWQGVEAAFKAFKLHDFLDSKERFAEFEREVRMMASVHHPNVLSFFGACLHPPRVGIPTFLSEYCSNGDLAEYLMVHADTAIDVRIRFLKEIAAALQYLHSKDIIHRDLKPENCLLNESLHIKVMDFGLSRTGKGSATKTTMVGTQSYMAPEIILSSGHYDSKIDVFSFGVVIFTLLTGRFEPYGAADVMLVEMKVAKDAAFRPQFEEGEEEKFPAPLMDLMRKCWGAEPEGRPTFKSIVDTLKGVE